MNTEEVRFFEDQITRASNRLRGRLCGLIESWGLPAKQERAAISTLKSISYDDEAALKDLLRGMSLQELDRV